MTESANMGISSDPTLLSVECSTFLAEEDASVCPLLSNTPSPPPTGFSHPLTSNIDNSCDLASCEDTKAETSSSGSSSVVITDKVTSTLLQAYQHHDKNAEIILQENGQKPNNILNITINKDTPSFISWNWPLIRKCTFFVFMSSLLAMCAIVIAMIATLPKTCNPRTSWYKGSVFYEIFPASFQDSNKDGLGDIRGITSRLDYFQNLGISGIRLNSIFSSKHYPDHYQMIKNLTKIDSVLGDINDLTQLIFALHSRNMSLILDLPLYPYLEKLDVPNVNTSTINDTTPTSIINTNGNIVSEAMRFWLSKGVDGFYVKGLEYFVDDTNLLENIVEWKYILGHDRVLIVSYNFIEKLDQKVIHKFLDNVDLVDYYLNVSNGTDYIYKQIKLPLDGVLKPSEKRTWIQWSLGGVSKQRLSKDLSSNATLAATLLQLMLPGTSNIFYGDEISLKESHDPFDEHIETKHLHHLSIMVWNGTNQFTNKESLPWLPKGASVAFDHFEEIVNMIALRNEAPSIYQNSFVRDDQIIQNTNIRYKENDILVVERYYPRKNSFVSVSNFGQETVTLDLTSMFYSGKVMVGRTKNSRIYFDKFDIQSMETIVVKLDK